MSQFMRPISLRRHSASGTSVCRRTTLNEYRKYIEQMRPPLWNALSNVKLSTIGEEAVQNFLKGCLRILHPTMRSYDEALRPLLEIFRPLSHGAISFAEQGD